MAAEETALAIDTGDTAFIIICAALVMLMTPALAMFYGGMVRKKNVLSTLMHGFITICVVSIIWVLYGYSLAFAPDVAGIVGNLDWAGFIGVGLDPNPDIVETIPHQLFAVFQLMFAIITVAIISGSFAERIRFPAFLLFIAIWVTVIYAPLAHWVWGGGWIDEMGALDFAGGTVVHISSGVTGLVLAILLGKRRGWGGSNGHTMAPHQLPMTVLGGALLWFGWFGFNAGSALAADGIAVAAFVTTNTATAAGALGWIAYEWIRQGKPTMLGAVSGAIAGLVAITPAAGFVTPLAAIPMGFISGIICYQAILMKSRLGYDDSLDAFGIHGVGGIWGALATGLFATTMVNADGADGLFYGNAELLLIQTIAVVATIIFVTIGTFVIYHIVNSIVKMRVSAEDEEIGLDISQHGEEAYPDFISPSGVATSSSIATSSSPVVQKTIPTQS
ncbi:ammonium transporter [Heliorestis acidaminivorans]|uniref:Ammonium transporter n=2 Tax=Heliorestis acidaminivorans TaxID=553427 RepID=A0A6I0F783_9FIRM|nr:ammonium transporter [Heliorestis acidaminivorans]KAB2953122.1 ammonium transporter [Heliorestis acidaminivorans]